MSPARMKTLVLGVLGLMVVLVIGLFVAFFVTRRPVAPAAGATRIAVSATGCTPNQVTVPAGKASFSIYNTGERAIEWEILDGVMVVAERENIAPGFTVSLSPHLEPGSYLMTCGLLSNPRGTLTVAAANGSTTASARPPTMTELVGPTAEYRVYVIKTIEATTTATKAMADAVKAGDEATAKAQYDMAAAKFAAIAPIADLLGPDAAALTSGPQSLGEMGKRLASPDSSGAPALAAAQVAASSDLEAKAHGVTAGPGAIVTGATTVLLAMVKSDVPAADVPLAKAKVEGIGKIVALFHPLTVRADKALAQKIGADLAALQATLSTLATPDVAPAKPGGTLLHDNLSDLAADFIDLSAALGLNAPEGGQ